MIHGLYFWGIKKGLTLGVDMDVIVELNGCSNNGVG